MKLTYNFHNVKLQSTILEPLTQNDVVIKITGDSGGDVHLHMSQAEFLQLYERLTPMDQVIKGLAEERKLISSMRRQPIDPIRRNHKQEQKLKAIDAPATEVKTEAETKAETEIVQTTRLPPRKGKGKEAILQETKDMDKGLYRRRGAKAKMTPERQAEITKKRLETRRRHRAAVDAEKAGLASSPPTGEFPDKV